MSLPTDAVSRSFALIEPPLSIHELVPVLIKHYGIHEGFYDLVVEFQVGMGPVGPDPDALTPGAMIGVSRVGLKRSETPGPTTINAAIVNPAKKSQKKLG